MLVAEDEGYYAEKGLEVTIDTGRGSVDAINRVASGAYDFGFADINNVVEFNATNPDSEVVAVMMVYDEAPFTLFALQGNGIAEPADLEGRTLGAPAFDASFKLFPAFATATGIDEAKVTKTNMDGSLRETMLINGDVDFISGHYHSSFLDLKTKGVDPADMVVMRYADHGLDFYGNAVIVRRETIESDPDLVRGFVAATVEGVRAVVADPSLGAKAAATRDPLIEEAVELERLLLTLDTLIDTDYVRANGVGTVDPERLERSIGQLAEAFAIDSPPTAATVFDASFLPPREMRLLP
jgi:NitT/TauT family transport system substrate-binding protein